MTIMRKTLLSLLAAPLALLALASPASAQNSSIEPFIKAEFWKKNITLEEFRANPRSYFRSEAAFDLLVDYVADEIGQPLTDAEFIALMRSDQVRARSCPISEMINTGALRGDQFYWFTRNCRSGEEIIQINLNGRWVDLISLNCLNSIEDQTPVASPIQTHTDPPSQPLVDFGGEPTTSQMTPFTPQIFTPAFIGGGNACGCC